MGIEAVAALMVALDRYAVPLTIAMCGQKPAAPVGRTVEREIVFGKGDADGSYKENIRSTGVASWYASAILPLGVKDTLVCTPGKLCARHASLPRGLPSSTTWMRPASPGPSTCPACAVSASDW